MDIQITRIGGATPSHPWESDAWVSKAVVTPAVIADMLAVYGLPSHEITTDLTDRMASVVRAYPKDLAPFGDRHEPPRPEARLAMVDTIRGWLKGLRAERLDHTMETREIPLFVFNSPLKATAEATYEVSHVAAVGAGWKIEFLGSGAEAEAELSVTQSALFRSTNGARKLVFAPLRLRLVKYALYKRDVFQHYFLKTEVAESGTRETNAIRSVDENEWKQLLADSRIVDRFDLSGDSSNDASEFKRTYGIDATAEAKVGFKAFDLESSAFIRCSANSKMETSFVLPPGAEYSLRSPSRIAGFAF